MKLVFAGLLLGVAIVSQAEYARPEEPSADISHLIQQLHDPDLDRRRDAARELSKILAAPTRGNQRDGVPARTTESRLCNTKLRF